MTWQLTAMLYRRINTEWLVNTGFGCVVPVHPVCQFFRLKRHFYLRRSATMLLRRWQKSNFSTSLGTNPSGWRERSEELDRWSPLPLVVIFLLPLLLLCTSISGFTFFQRSIVAVLLLGCLWENCILYGWMTCSFTSHPVHIKFSPSTGFSVNGFVSKWFKVKVQSNLEFSSYIFLIDSDQNNWELNQII